MKINVLGCSGGIGKDLKTTTFCVDDSLVIDPGTGLELMELDQMLAIRGIVITHAHLDHIIGLPLMLATIFDQHQHSIPVYALPDVIDALKTHIFNWTVWPDYTQLPKDKPIIELHTLKPGDQITLEGKTITMLPAVHPTPTAGYLLDDGQTRFAFTGDTGCNDALWPILNQHQPDLLIIDVSFTDDVSELARLSGHLTPSQLADQLSQFEHPAKIRITHMKPGFEEQIVERCQDLLPDWALDRLHQGEVIHLIP